MPTLSSLQETRSSKFDALKAIDMTKEPEKFDTLESEIRALDTQIGRVKKMDELERTAPAIVSAGNVGDGEYEERARGFSITKAIAAKIGENVDAGFEREISQEVQKRAGRKFEGIAVPDEVFLEKRTLLAGSSAADLIPNVHRGDLFIDRLRSALVVGRLGATVLDGLVGNVDIPRQTGSSTAQWVGEDGSLTETDASFDDVNLVPKTVGAMTSYSRRTLINAVPSVDNLVRADLAKVIASAVDYQALLGDGSGNTPTGVAHVSGVATPTLGTPSWAEVLGVIASIQNEDADIGNMGWAMSPDAIKLLRATTKVSGDGSAGFLMDSPNAMAGYAAVSSTAIPSGGSPAAATVFFGAWSQLLVASWSGTDLLVNPYETTAYAKGRVLVRAMRDVNVAVRHAESFAVVTDLDA